MFAVNTYSDIFIEELKLKQWEVANDGELTIVEADHIIDEPILGFNPKDLNKTFEYSKKIKDQDITICGYIDPRTNYCHMNSITIDLKPKAATYYRTQDVYGDGVGYLATPSILNYLIADNYLTGISVDESKVFSKVGDKVYSDSVDNLYCRDTITRWGFLIQIVLERREFTTKMFDSARGQNITIADRMNTYSTAKSDSIEVFLMDPIIGEFWKGVHIDDIPDSDSVTMHQLEGTVPTSYIDSWTLPSVVRGKKDLLPLLGYMLD